MGLKKRIMVKDVSVLLLSSLVAIVFAGAASPRDESATKTATSALRPAAGVATSMKAPVQRAPADSSDDVIRRAVEKALDDLDAVANANIDVRVNDGIVRLSGTVPAWQGNDARISATRSVTGVRAILNGVRVVALTPRRR